MAFSGNIGPIFTGVGTGKYVAVGERLNMNMLIQNTGDVSMAVLGVYVYNSAQRAADMEPYLVYEAKTDFSIWLMPGEQRMVQFTCDMCDPGFGGARTCNPYVHVRCDAVTHDGSNEHRTEKWLAAELGENVLDMRYRPTVAALTVKRTPNEDGTQAKINVRCTLAEGANAQYSGLSLVVRWREQGIGTFAPSDSVTVPAAQALTAAGADVTLSDTFSASGGFVFRAVFTDGYDSAAYETVLPRAQVNFHLAGNGCGVAAGMYSSGTEELPLFESAYRARFYDGAEGYMQYSTGERDTGMRWYDGTPVYCRAFTGTALTNGGSTIIGAIPNISALVRVDGYVQRDSGGYFPATFAYYGNLNQAVGVNVGNDDNVYVYKGDSWPVIAYAIAILYTKTAG